MSNIKDVPERNSPDPILPEPYEHEGLEEAPEGAEPAGNKPQRVDDDAANEIDPSTGLPGGGGAI